MKKALIVIDLINGIIGKESRNYEQVNANELIKKTNKATAFARRNNIEVIWVKVGFNDDYSDVLIHSPLFANITQSGGLKLSESSCDWDSSLILEESDHFYVKKGIGAFCGNHLQMTLTALGITELFFTGVSTAFAIQSSVRLAHDLGFRVNVIDDLCCASTHEQHQSSIDVLKNMATVISVNDFINE